MSKILQYSFAGGEISPSAYGRSDLEKHRTGLKTCRNFLPQARGAAQNRPGLQHLARAAYDDEDKAVRLIDFQFNTEQTYVLEFGDLYMRVWTDGGLVLETSQATTSITGANPAVVTITAHGYSDGDWVFVTDVPSDIGDLINNKFFIVANSTANTFNLQYLDGGLVDTSAFFPVSSGNFAKVFELTTPYAEDDLALLKYEQSADILTLVHPDYEPRDLSRLANDNWQLDVIDFEPQIDTPINVTIAGISLGTGNSDYIYVVTAIDAESFEESSRSAEVTLTNTDNDLNTDQRIRLTWDAVSGAGTYNVYRSKNGSKLAFIGDSETTEFEDEGYNADAASAPPPATPRNPFDSADNYPGVIAYYQQRKVFARTNNDPQTIFTTQIGNLNNMNTSEPSRDDDAITFKLIARKANEVRHVVPLRDMVAFTSGAEWRVEGADDGVFSPSTVKQRPQTYWGASHVRPITVGNTILFVQEDGSRVRDLGYTFDSDGYDGTDLSVLSNHLFVNREIKEWAYQKEPESIIWAVMDDGSLLSLTYQKEHQVLAWARHDTDGKFLSVAAVEEGDETAVYVVVQRETDGNSLKYIERFHTRQIANEARNAFFVDGGSTFDKPLDIEDITTGTSTVITITAHGYSNDDIVELDEIEGVQVEIDEQVQTLNLRKYVLTNVTANTFEILDVDDMDPIDTSSYSDYKRGGVSRIATETVSGLDHLEGVAVSVLADGNVVSTTEEGNIVVSNGAIDIGFPASRIHIGRQYLSDVQTLDPEIPKQDSPGKPKTAAQTGLKLEETRGGFFGQNEDELYEIPERELELWGDPTDLFTGQTEAFMPPGWTDEGSIFIRQSDPLPMSLLAISPDVLIGGYD